MNRLQARAARKRAHAIIHERNLILRLYDTQNLSLIAALADAGGPSTSMEDFNAYVVPYVLRQITKNLRTE